MNIIQELEREQIEAVRKTRRVPEFSPGDTVKVMVKVIEDAGNDRSTRLQAFEGVVIARSGGSINESFTVRKISYGEGVERVFPLYSPNIAEIEVLRRGKTRRAKLYYLRGRRGKAARISERTDRRARVLNAQWIGFERPAGEPDDLTRINGIDADLAARLNTLNCIKFAQIANFSAQDVENVDQSLRLRGRIRRDGWITAAKNIFEYLPESSTASGEQSSVKQSIPLQKRLATTKNRVTDLEAAKSKDTGSVPFQSDSDRDKVVAIKGLTDVIKQFSNSELDSVADRAAELGEAIGKLEPGSALFKQSCQTAFKAAKDVKSELKGYSLLAVLACLEEAGMPGKAAEAGKEFNRELVRSQDTLPEHCNILLRVGRLLQGSETDASSNTFLVAAMDKALDVGNLKVAAKAAELIERSGDTKVRGLVLEHGTK